MEYYYTTFIIMVGVVIVGFCAGVITLSTDYTLLNKTIIIDNKETYHSFSDTDYYVSDGKNVYYVEDIKMYTRLNINNSYNVTVKNSSSSGLSIIKVN